jgi:hypothetical protein
MSETPPEVEIALLQKELVDLTDKVDTLSKDVAGLLEMWRTASGVVGFIKWLSGLVVAVGILWTAFKVKTGG